MQKAKPHPLAKVINVSYTQLLLLRRLQLPCMSGSRWVENAHAVIIHDIAHHWLQAERHALRKDVTRAQTQLLEAQASSRAAEAAASSSHEEKVAMAETLSSARFASNCPAAVLTRRPLCGNASTQCALHQRLTPCYVFDLLFKCEHEADLDQHGHTNLLHCDTALLICCSAVSPRTTPGSFIIACCSPRLLR